MQCIDLAQLPALSSYLELDTNEPLFLTRNGETVAAVVPTSGEDAESMVLNINPQFQAILERSQRRLESEGGLTSDEVRSRLGLPASGG